MDLLSILMQPADTWNYFVMGYAICFSVMGIYLVSYFVRFRNLRRELVLLEELERESEE
jgi:ABC-type sulfate transport system permease subunit